MQRGPLAGVEGTQPPSVEASPPSLEASAPSVCASASEPASSIVPLLEAVPLEEEPLEEEPLEDEPLEDVIVPLDEVGPVVVPLDAASAMRHLPSTHWRPTRHDLFAKQG